MAKTTKTITVRASIEAIDRFVARCREQGLAPSRVLRDVIEPPKKKAVAGNPAAPLAKPTGFDAITGEPIFKSGVGPRGGKKK